MTNAIDGPKNSRAGKGIFNGNSLVIRTLKEIRASIVDMSAQVLKSMAIYQPVLERGGTSIPRFQQRGKPMA
jgi:hypothetical protein